MLSQGLQANCMIGANIATARATTAKASGHSNDDISHFQCMLNDWLCVRQKIFVLLLLFLLWPTSTKPQAWILRKDYNGCSFGRPGVLKNRPHYPVEELSTGWNKNVVSLESSVMTVTRRPISCTNSIAMAFHVPATSIIIIINYYYYYINNLQHCNYKWDHNNDANFI